MPLATKAYVGQIIYGLGGTGKTWYCRAAAEAVGWERTLWINTDRPIDSFDAHRHTAAEPWGIIDALDTPIERVVKLVDQASRQAALRRWLYDLVVFDGITETERVNFAALKAANPEAKDPRRIWGEQAGDLQELIWKLRAGRREPDARYLGAHVIITATTREVSDEETPVDEKGQPVTQLRPSIRGQFGEDIDRYYNQVLYIRTRGQARLLYLKPTGRVHIKNDWEHVQGVPPLLQVGDFTKGANPFVEVLRRHNLVQEVK